MILFFIKKEIRIRDKEDIRRIVVKVIIDGIVNVHIIEENLKKDKEIEVIREIITQIISNLILEKEVL